MAKSKKKKKKGIDPLVMILVIFVFFVAIIILPKLISSNTVAMPKGRIHPNANFNVMGDENAPLSVVLYSDFQCSHCYNFYNGTEEEFIKEYVETGLASYEFRSFGNGMGPESADAAAAAYCAGDQGMFWEYHDVLYENYSYGNSGGYSEDNLLKFGEKIGLEMNSFEACVVNGTYADRVAQDQVDGKTDGVSGTPSIFVNGVLTFPGNVPFEDMKSGLDNVLANQ